MDPYHRYNPAPPPYPPSSGPPPPFSHPPYPYPAQPQQPPPPLQPAQYYNGYGPPPPQQPPPPPYGAAPFNPHAPPPPPLRPPFSQYAPGPPPHQPPLHQPPPHPPHIQASAPLPPAPRQPYYNSPPYNTVPAHPTAPHAASATMASSFNPSGRRRALLVGINYTGSAQLQGCVTDVTFVHHLLKSKFGFRSADFTILTDVSSGIRNVRQHRPTKRRMMDELKSLVSTAKAGDSLWFSFSGHGSQQRDTSGDESDGYDETILPMDYKTAGHIVDDDLYKIVSRVPAGARLTVLLDACHSGTGLDLPYQHDVFGTGTGQHVSSSRPSSIAAMLFNVGGALISGNTSGVIQGISNTFRPKKKKPHPSNPHAGQVMLFSGCKDNQTSADTSKLTGGIPTGAMTFALIETLEHTSVGDWRNYTYRKLLQTMRQKLRDAHLTQTPQFSTLHPFDLNTPFRL